MDFEEAFFDTSDFELTNRRIGSGSFGDVYIAKSITDHIQYAAKLIDPRHLRDGRSQMMFIREAGILHKLDHPAIVKFFGINFHSFDDEAVFSPIILTEYLQNGSLKKILDKKNFKIFGHLPKNTFVYLVFAVQ